MQAQTIVDHFVMKLRNQAEHLEAWARHFEGYRSVQRVEILPYHKLGVHKWPHLVMRASL